MSTNPADWFLLPSDLPRSPAYTSGNHVEALIDGKNYFDHLALRLSSLRGGVISGNEYVHLSGWRVSPDQKLRPYDDSSPTIETEFLRLVSDGVKVKVMLWDAIPHPVHRAENRRFVKTVAGDEGQAILDVRVPLGGSHHQKVIVLGNAQGHWAYVGGIDICADRWDTQQHNNSPHRTMENYNAWHDIHAAVSGPAVPQIWDNFADRWNDRTVPRPTIGPLIDVPGDEAPAVIPSTDRPSPRPVFPGPSLLTSPHSDNAHIQVLRTMACNQYPFLREGEQTIRMAHEKAIRKANHYIYIEEQYFWPCSLIQELAARAAAGVKIILVLQRDIIPLYGPHYVHNALRYRAIEEIRRGNPNNVFVFHLAQPPRASQPDSVIYCHSKLLIVDDQFASIGTANVGLRSLTTDSEIQIAVIDGNSVNGKMNGNDLRVCQFARELRIELWAEHLDLSNRDAVIDPIVGLAEWPSAPGVQKHHAVGHAVPFAQWPLSAVIGGLAGGTNLLPNLIEDSVLNVETTCP